MTSRIARLWLAAGLLVSAAALTKAQPPAYGPVPAYRPASGPDSGADEMIGSFKLREADIDSVLSELEALTGRSIVRPGVLPTASYTITIDRPIPKSELILALETLLSLNQVAVAPMGDRFLKVIALSQAKTEAPEMVIGSSLDLPQSGKIATKLFELNFLRVAEFAPQLQQLLSPGINGGAIQLEKANALIITDTISNIQRVERLIQELDRPHEENLIPKFYTLEYTKASDLVTKIHSMLSGAAQNELRATTSYTADDRTNQIILIADPREYPLFDSLISRLDIKADPNTRNEVLYLKHADAKDVSTLLTQLISGQNSASQKSGSTSVHPAGQPAPAVNQVALSAAEGVLGGTNEFSSYITVEPDTRTNSIVVSGTGDDIRLIQQIINKVDILLAQVSLQVVIAEVTLNDEDSSGISSGSLSFLGNGHDLGSIGNASVVGPTATAAGGATLGGVSGGATAVVAGSNLATDLNPMNLVATIQALGDRQKVTVLEAQTIVTTHNKQAQIVVSKQEPIITGTVSTPTGLTATSSSSSLSTSSSVSYKDIGVTLKVTPLIGDDGSIQLDIDQTVDDVQGNVQIDGNSQPIIGHREAQSFLNVMDGQIVVLGGFQESQRSTDSQKLGLIYEIPIIGNLLGSKDNALARTELYLFILPHVMHGPQFSAVTKAGINGMDNKEQINQFLKNPNRMPDYNPGVKERYK